MRIIDPKQFRHDQPVRKSRRYVWPLAVLAVVATAAVWLIFRSDSSSPESLTQADQQQVTGDQAQQDTEQEEQPAAQGLRQFSGNEFRIFYDNLRQPKLEQVANPPVISGNDVADAHIRKLAEDRGYRLRSSPNVNLATYDGYPMQTEAGEAWLKLKAAAAAEGLGISMVSGYRSVNEQRNLFLQRLAATGASIEAVAAGEVDAEIDYVLTTTSIPGYSKHHTGYTQDWACAGYAFENFKNSPCNDWLEADNFKVAKEHGFIPSYPPGADSQGPDPEAWEYVWVGTDLLYE